MEDLAVWTTVPLMIWGIVVGHLLFQNNYCSFLVRTAGKSVAGAAALTLAVHVVAMTLFAVTARLINDLVKPHLPTWCAVFLFALAGMLYSPLAGLAMPQRRWPPYDDIRRALKRSGATLGQERAIAWIGGLLSIPGMMAILPAALVLFA